MSFYTYIPTKFQWRKDTAANWAANNPTPLQGEPCLETDTGLYKVGDGVTDYTSLLHSGAILDLTSIVDGDAMLWDDTNKKFAPFAVMLPGDNVSDLTNDAGYLTDAPSDGTGYVRKDGAWASESVGGGGGTDLTTTAQLYDECYGSTTTQAGWVEDVSAGSAVVTQQIVAGMNGAYKLTCAATSATRAVISHGGFWAEVGAGEIRMAFRARPEHTPSGAQQSDYWLGLNSGAFGSGDVIRARANDTTGGWLLSWACAAGTPTSGTSVIPATITGGTTQLLELTIAADGLSVAFSVDGTLVDTLTLPTGFLRLKPLAASRKNGATGGASSLWVDKVLVEQDR